MDLVTKPKTDDDTLSENIIYVLQLKQYEGCDAKYINTLIHFIFWYVGSEENRLQSPARWYDFDSMKQK